MCEVGALEPVLYRPPCYSYFSRCLFLARSAAKAAAVANAEAGDVDGYAMTSAAVMDAEPCVDARLWVASPAGIQQVTANAATSSNWSL